MGGYLALSIGSVWSWYEREAGGSELGKEVWRQKLKLCHCRKGATNQGMLARKDKAVNSFLELPGLQPCWCLLFETSDLQNHKIINVCAFKPLSLWSFFTAVINKYSLWPNGSFSTVRGAALYGYSHDFLAITAFTCQFIAVSHKLVLYRGCTLASRQSWQGKPSPPPSCLQETISIPPAGN